MNILIGHVFYILGLLAFALAVPAEVWDPSAAKFILIIGTLALWRYSWALLNWLRFLIFTHVTFPKWRKASDDLGEDGLPPHMYLLVTSFRIGAETTRRVYASVFEEAIYYNHPTTIIASIVERADQTLIKNIFETYQPPEHIKLIFVRIDGTGKRDAIACGLRSLSRQIPPEGSVAAVIDGDSLMPQGLIKNCAPMFVLMPNLAALTTDETCEVEGKWIFKEWYNMRFAQRHVYMSSCSLSRRVLTLTGRMSMFRVSRVIDPKFIEQIELDWIDHWRLGRFKFLTGDDKSSWFNILKSGQEMIYIPDVNVVTIETPPNPSFIKSSVTLMHRWFGNMLRTNGRALTLGPKPMGWFPWFAILDQRISMWTSLISPFIAILATIFATPFALVYYLLWMGITRYVITISLLAARQRVSAFYPFLLYYNQVVGSFMKTIVLFRLDKQKWTRQNTTLTRNVTSISERVMQLSSAYMHLFAFSAFIFSLALISNILHVPDFPFWYDIVMEY